MEWNETGRFKVLSDESRLIARFVLENLTKDNQRKLRKLIQQVWQTQTMTGGDSPTWLDPKIAGIIGMVVGQRASAYNRASQRGDLGPEAPLCPLNQANWQYAIGATACEMIHSGEIPTPWMTEEAETA